MAQNEEIIRDMLTDFMPADPDQGMELLDKTTDRKSVV